MNKKKNNFRAYKRERESKTAFLQLTENEKLSKIETSNDDLKGKENEVIRKLFQINFQFLFPDLTLLTKQNIYVIQHGKRAGDKLDDLAFDEELRIFYILEYKSELNTEQINQALTYWNALREPANHYHLHWKYLRNEQGKELKWKNMKIICVSPEFTEYQKGAENEMINLIRITKYKNGTISLESK